MAKVLMSAGADPNQKTGNQTIFHVFVRMLPFKFGPVINFCPNSWSNWISMLPLLLAHGADYNVFFEAGIRDGQHDSFFSKWLWMSASRYVDKEIVDKFCDVFNHLLAAGLEPNRVFYTNFKSTPWLHFVHGILCDPNCDLGEPLFDLTTRFIRAGANLDTTVHGPDGVGYGTAGACVEKCFSYDSHMLARIKAEIEQRAYHNRQSAYRDRRTPIGERRHNDDRYDPRNSNRGRYGQRQRHGRRW
jgi:hypothetical protein